jgi:hypothetical protein
MNVIFRIVRPLTLMALVAALAAGCSDDITAPAPGSSDDPALSQLLNRPASQVDRFGFPAIATVFIPTTQKDAFNTGQPSEDQANFRSFVVNQLLAFGNSQAAADGLANALLPDIQPIDLTQASGFLNGRRPQDDVITAELGLIFGSNADLNDDHVDANDKPFLSTFPYLAGPWTE